MGKIRGELEDLAFQYVDPIAYKQVKEASSHAAKRARPSGQDPDRHRAEAEREQHPARVDARIKRMYSI